MKKKLFLLIVFILSFVLIDSKYVFALEDDKSVYIEVDGVVNYYETLSDAIANVKDNVQTTIVLQDNVELGSALTINANKDIIIDGNNKTITYMQKADSTWYTGQLFNIKASGKLKLLNVTIDGNNNYAFDVDTYEEDLKKGEKISTVLKYITAEVGKPDIKTTMINNAGILEIDNSNIKNFYSSSGKNLINSSAGTTTTIKNTSINHCATSGSGLVVYVTGSNAIVYVEDGTIIDDNFVAGNGGIFKVYNGALLEINGGEVRNTKSVNTNGVVSMSYGSGTKVVLNGGLITNNSGLIGTSNGRNAPIYIHSGSQFIMNGGNIENNIGTSAGGIDAPGHTTSNIKLNAGTIKNNSVSNDSYNYRSNLNVQYDYDLVLGEGMVIVGNIYVNGEVENRGSITGGVTIDLTSSTNIDTISGSGQVNGDVIIKYDGEEKPKVSDDVNIIGRVVSYEANIQAVARFEFNGGLDKEEFSYDLVAVTKENGILEKVPVPLKKGNTFKGWFKNKELTLEWKNEPVTEDIVLYADWEVNDYIVTWNNNGKISKVVYKYGDIIKLPEEPSRDDYVFAGWDNYVEGMTVPDYDIKFTAKWVKLTNPDTYDNIYIHIFTLIISLILILFTYLHLIKTKKNIS